MWTHQKGKFRFRKSTMTPVALAVLEELFVDERADMDGEEYIIVRQNDVLVIVK